MTDEHALLAALIANPEDDHLRLAYADWLDERGDPRGEYLRLSHRVYRSGPGEDAINLLPPVHEMSKRIDPEWVAVVDTLGYPFRSFNVNYETREHPFTESIGSRGRLATFESQFRSLDWNPGLAHDAAFLLGLELGRCAYGPADDEVEPFMTGLPTGRDPLTAADVLAALKVRDFRSQHIRGLDRTTIRYPGYHAYTANDEIHTEFGGQYVFARERPEDERDGVHGALKGYVKGGRLWYVLLHTYTSDGSGFEGRAGNVVLFAVGRSPHGNRLVGVVTTQVCHNLCD